MVRRYLEYPVVYKVLIGFILGIIVGIVIGELITLLGSLGDLIIRQLKMVVIQLVFSLVISAISIKPSRLGGVIFLKDF